MGTEFGLAHAKPIYCREVLPWLDAANDPLFGMRDEWDLPIDADQCKLGFPNALSAPTLMHIIHNAAVGMTDVMPT